MMKHSTYTSYDKLPLMLSVVEVAAVLGISRGGADAALSRARARLREQWEKREAVEGR